MDKLTYLAELAEGLARWVPERERQDILRYYAEYFEEAGPEREAQVVQELGDPWALSCRLAVEGGFVTQEAANSWTPPKKKKWPWVLLGTAAVLVFVIVSVASAAAQIGQVVGRFVGQTPERQVAVDEVTVVEGISEGAVYFEGEESIGGLWSAEDGTLDMFESIDADISLGNITICPGTDFTLFTNQGVNLSGYSVQWEVKDDVLKLRDGTAVKQAEINDWNDLKSLFSRVDYTLDVTITVPEGFELGKISAKTDLGNIYLCDVYVAQKVEAETSMGNVECYEVRTDNKIDLKTSMGNVTLGLGELYDGVDIDLETSMGNVEANLECTELECEYELKTDMGTVAVNGMDRGGKAERKGSYSYKLDAESSMGDVDVYFVDSRW